MNYLVDTHSLIWFIENNPRLSAAARIVIENMENGVFVSIASAWEMAIKSSIGKLNPPIPLKELLPGILNEHAINVLQVDYAHIWEVERLPLHHQDPFDRMIIAQAKTEKMPVITCDPQFSKYDIQVIW